MMQVSRMLGGFQDLRWVPGCLCPGPMDQAFERDHAEATRYQVRGSVISHAVICFLELKQLYFMTQGFSQELLTTVRWFKLRGQKTLATSPWIVTKVILMVSHKPCGHMRCQDIEKLYEVRRDFFPHGSSDPARKSICDWWETTRQLYDFMIGTWRSVALSCNPVLL